MAKPAINTGPDGTPRCAWCLADALYVRYHDEEWGVPAIRGVDDDVRVFEKICLEGFQAGLSWLTILRKRKRFREVFHGFEIERVSRMTARDVTRLLKDAGIVRHRGKIESTINNAKRAIEMRKESGGAIAPFIRSFAPKKHARPGTMKDIPVKTPESIALSKDLRKRGWTFVGPTTMYAFMQAVGMVNDHVEGCGMGRR